MVLGAKFSLNISIFNKKGQAAGPPAIALALADGEIDAERATDASWLEASFRMQRWGGDEEATRRLAILRAEFERAAAFQGPCPGVGMRKLEDGGRWRAIRAPRRSA